VSLLWILLIFGEGASNLPVVGGGAVLVLISASMHNFFISFISVGSGFLVYVMLTSLRLKLFHQDGWRIVC